MGIFSIEALAIAISRAWYIIPSSCLYDGSCSSSSTIRPKFLNGNVKEERAPITKFKLPFMIACQIFLLLFIPIFECQIEGENPKNSINLSLNWLVKNISGNKIKTCLPEFKISFTLSK